MPFDDDLGDIVTPDVSWAYRPASQLGAADSPEVDSKDAEPHASRSSRRQRALGLIAISVIVATVAGVRYVNTMVPKPIAAAIFHTSSEPQVTGPIPIPELSQVFTSPVMRYSVKYPTDWFATPATQPWHGEWANWNSTDTDHLDGGFVAFWASSEPLARGQSAANWLYRYLATVGPNKCGLEEKVAVAGHAGLIIMNGCNSEDLPGSTYDVVFVAGGRAYDLSMEGQVDHTYFLAMLATVKLQP